MEIRQQVEVDLNIPVVIKKDHETGLYVVYSPALELSTQGKTRSQALKNYAEAVQLFFESCIERGTFAEAMAELGWRKVERPRPHWVPPQVLEQRNLSVRVPAYA